MPSSSVACFSCGQIVPVLGSVGRRDECFKCRADLHVCKNCIHYDARSYNECREPQADRVQEKDRSNFCDHFSPLASRSASDNAAADMLAKAEALFSGAKPKKD